MCIIKAHLTMLKGLKLGLKKVVGRKEKYIIFASQLYAREDSPDKAGRTFRTGIRRFTQLNYWRDRIIFILSNLKISNSP